MDKKHLRYLNFLEKMAINMDFSCEKTSRCRVASLITIKNDIISVGTNNFKSHPFQTKFQRNEQSIFLHAETDAIKNALKIVNVEDLSRSVLYVLRVKYEDPSKRKIVWGLSRPCVGCQRAIVTYGIRRVIYSLDESGYEFL